MKKYDTGRPPPPNPHKKEKKKEKKAFERTRHVEIREDDIAGRGLSVLTYTGL